MNCALPPVLLAEKAGDPAVVGGDRRVAGAAPLEEVRVSIVSDVGIAGGSRAAPEKTRCETQLSELVDGDRCIFSTARACEKNEPIGIRPDGTCRQTCDQCRVTCATRVVKFNVRVSKSRDRRVISSAVPLEKYEAAGEVIGTTHITRDQFRGSCCGSVMEVHRTRTVDVDGRGVSAALVKEIHNALAGDGESGGAGVAHIVKIRYPGGGGGGDRCAASAARVEKIRYPCRSDRGIAGAAPFVEFYQPTASDNGVACRGRAALELAAVVK